MDNQSNGSLDCSEKKALKELCNLNLKHAKIKKHIETLSKNLRDETLKGINDLKDDEKRNLKINVKSLMNYYNSTDKLVEPIIDVIFILIIWIMLLILLEIATLLNMDLESIKNSFIKNSFIKNSFIKNSFIISIFVPLSVFLYRILNSFYRSLLLAYWKERDFHIEKFISCVLDPEIIN